MRTQPTELHGQTFDLLVVGGGIQGAAIAREAAVRGLTVALVECGDFACGTSSRSSRLVHGGVRYLEQGHISLVREALRERERLLRGAPHLVRPLPMLMPFFEGGGKSPLLLKLGLRIYDWLAGRSTMPGPCSVGAVECERLFPGVRTRGLRGGALYYDAATQDSRLTLAVARAAARAGAKLTNHTELVGHRGDAVVLRDALGDREVEVRAGLVINAAGPGVDAVRAHLGVAAEPLVRLSRGSHLVFDAVDCETALAGFLPDGRIQFVIPHPDGLLAGTTDVADETDDPGVPEADITYLLESMGHFLATPPTRGDVRWAYAGWRALPLAKGPPGQLNREAFVVDERSPVGAVASVVGGKLTTHRSFAERVIDRLAPDSGPSRTRDVPLPGGEGPHDVGDPLWWRHGSETSAIRSRARSDQARLEPLCPHRPFLGVELHHAVDELGAMTFADVMLRRLVDTRGPCLQDGCLRHAHEVYAAAVPDAADAAADLEALRAEVRRELGDAEPVSVR